MLANLSAQSALHYSAAEPQLPFWHCISSRKGQRGSPRHSRQHSCLLLCPTRHTSSLHQDRERKGGDLCKSRGLYAVFSFRMTGTAKLKMTIWGMSHQRHFPPRWVGKKHVHTNARVSGPCTPGAGTGTADVPRGTTASSPPRADESTANAVCTQPQLRKHEKHRQNNKIV